MTPQALSALKEQREQLWSTIDAVLEENAKLRGEVDSLRSAPVALMVPGMDDNAELLPILEEAGKDLDCGRIALNAWIVKHANPTPSSRLLKEGEIHGTPEDLAAIAEGAGWEWIRSHIGGKSLVDYMADALRSKGGE